MVKKLPEATNQELGQESQSPLIYFLILQLPRLFLSLVLFIGGIALLALRISGWSLILGLPSTQIGLIFLIFTFDQLAQRRLGPENLRTVPCSVCGRPTLTPYGQKSDICENCQKKTTYNQKLTSSLHPDRL